MDVKTILIVLLSASVAAYFIPTPNELQTNFMNGQTLYAAKNYKGAIDLYDKIIETESDFLKADSIRVSLFNKEVSVGVRTAAYYQKANAFRNLGKKDESIEVFRIVERRTDSPMLSALAQFQIYEMYYAEKNYRQAITEAQTLIERYPFDQKVPRAWYDIGWAYRELGMMDSSNLAFRTLTTNYPKDELDPRARYQLAQNYFDEKEWDRAIETFTDLIERYRPESFASAEWENVELKVLRERKLFEAQAGRDINPTTLELVANGQVRIGDSYQKKGLYDQAMAAYRKVIAVFGLLPTLVEATYIKMAQYTTELKGIEEGIQIFRQAIDENFGNKPLQAKVQYKIAKTYQDAKLYSKAAGEYLFYAQAYRQQAQEIKFSVEEAMFLAISNFYNAREYQNTLAYADTMLQTYPSGDLAPKLNTYRGLTSLGLSRHQAAREYFALVYQSAPRSNEAIVARTQTGKSYFDERKYKEAVTAFEDLLTYDPSKLDTSEIHYLLGLSYYGLGEYDKAIEQLSAVDASSSYFPFTFARITRAYVSQQRYEEAERYLNTSFAAAKNDSVDHSPFVRLARSELHTAQQKYSLSIAQFDTVIQDQSLTENTRMQALYGRGLVYFEMGNFKQAAADLQRCLSSAVFQGVFSALVPQAKEKLAFSFVNIGKSTEGSGLLRELMSSAGSDFEKSKYLAMLCEFFYRSGEYTKAIETGTALLAMNEKDEYAVIRTYVTLSNSYGNLRQHEKAVGILKEAGEHFPENTYLDEVFFQLGMIYYNGGDYKSALQAFQSHRQKYPESKFKEDDAYYAAFSEYHMGQAEKSIASFREFLRDFPSSKRAAEIQMQIGETYYNTQRFEEATTEYQLVYRRYPQNPNAAQALFNEGWCYYQLQRYEKMLAAFRSVVEKYPGSKLVADAQFTIGDYYYNQKNYDAALAAYQRFLDQFPAEPRSEEARGLIKDLSQVEAYKEYEAAMAFFDAKNWKVAVEELTKVMKNYPTTDVVFGCKANIASAYEQLGERKKALALFEEIIQEWKDIEAARPTVFFSEMHRRWIEAGK